MRFARPGLLAVLIVALGTYALDCLAVTPQQAMQCCQSMRCASHGHHGKDCCKTMPAMRAALGQPTSVQDVSFSPVVLGILKALNGSSSSSSQTSTAVITAHSHAPPIFFSPPPLPLRI